MLVALTTVQYVTRLVIEVWPRSEIMWRADTSQTLSVIVALSVKWRLVRKQILKTTSADNTKCHMFNCETVKINAWNMFSVLIVGPDGARVSQPTDLDRYILRNPDKSHSCSICCLFSHKIRTAVRNHIEAIHFPSLFTYTCERCSVQFSNKTAINNHKSKCKHYWLILCCNTNPQLQWIWSENHIWTQD